MVGGIMCIGPSRIFNLPSKSWIVISGLGLGGFGRGVINGFPTADAMKGGVLAFPSKSTEVTDIISAMMTMTTGINSLVTPNAAAELNSALGFSTSMDIVLIITLITMLLFTVSSCLDVRRERIQKNTAIYSPLVG